MRHRVWTAVFVLAACVMLGGCSRQTADVGSAADGTAGGSMTGGNAAGEGMNGGNAAGEGVTDGNVTGGGITGGNGANGTGESAGELAQSPGQTAEGENPGQNAAGESSGQLSEEETGKEPFVQQKIVIATDLHYLAEELSGNRGQSFMTAVEGSDGRALQYGWEILDAFIEDMLREKPDIILLSGDLTLNGEKRSHEELAEKLEVLTENGIPVIVIPGNHDINNPDARKFNSDGRERTDSVTAEEFAEIYADYGYVAADSRDPASLSYVYKLDDYYWLMMLDTCQYEPFNRIGGMIGRDTYDWIDGWLEESWDQGAQFISVSHHNLLDQSGVSRDFYDNCTIEHNEELIERLSGGDVRLHLSGHLHLQHHMQDADSGIYEVVTGSMVMAPCQYGVLKIMDNGELVYDAVSVDVEGWAERKGYRNRALTDFRAYSEEFLRTVTYRNAQKDLRQHTVERKLRLSDGRIDEMAAFYARLCVYYYGGRMLEIADQVAQDPAFQYWNDVDYVSDLSDFLRNILNDDARDFAHLTVPY